MRAMAQLLKHGWHACKQAGSINSVSRSTTFPTMFQFCSNMMGCCFVGKPKARFSVDNSESGSVSEC